MSEKKKPSVFIATFAMLERGGWYCPQLVSFLLTAQSRSAADGRRSVQLQIRNCRPIDAARNFTANEFLKSGLDWLVMSDNDMAPPLGIFKMIDEADTRMDIVVPRFYSVTDDGLRLIWAPLPTENIDSGAEWIELSEAGTGVMAIRRRVFERLGKPYFKTIFNEEDRRIIKGEDWNFCEKARAAGFRLFGNVRFSADHFRTVGLNMAVENGVRAMIEKPASAR